ncbi:MAG: JAB domain-containing protein [Vicinamibacteria bacterium]
MYVAELKRRRYRGKRALEVGTPAQAYAVLKPRIEDWSREHFLAILLDSRNRILGIETVSVGSLSASIVHPREVFKPAIAASAAGIVLGHNHPSGDPEPSPEDMAVTRRIHEAGTLLGIEVLDHLVFTPSRFVSLKERGSL